MSTATTKTPSRHLPFDGTPNFRDDGGYTTEDGRQVKWRTLFRSGHLSTLTASDQLQFSKLGINLVFDFRRVEECKREPSQFHAGAMPQVVGLPIDPGSSFSFIESIASGRLSRADMLDFMAKVNREFVFAQADSFKQMLHHLLHQQQGGSLIHCAAGKDRTGFGVAMMLSALGVPRATIFADYLLTSQYLDVDSEIDRICKKYQWPGETDVMRPLLEVREPYLQAAFDEIDSRYACVDDYLQEVLDIGPSERRELRSRFLV